MLELPAPLQFIGQRERVDDPAAFRDRNHGAEQTPMSFAVEHRVVDMFRRTHDGIGVEQHGTKNGLLGLLGPGWATFLERIARGRYGSVRNDETGHGDAGSALAKRDASRMRRASFTSSHVGRFHDSLRSNAAG